MNWRAVGVFLLTSFIALSGVTLGDVHGPGTTIEVILTMVDVETGSAISGETPTAAIFQHATGDWLDWDDMTFKSSGWTLKDQPMSEIETTGRYSVSFDSTGQDLGCYAAFLTNTGDNANEDTLSFYIATTGQGYGQVPINHDYPLTDSMTILDETLAPVADARVRVYSKTNYDAGRVSENYVIGSTTTDVDGHWIDFIWLDPADYVVVVTKAGLQTQTVDVTVSAP